MKKTMLVMAMAVALAMSTMAGALASDWPDADILSPTDDAMVYIGTDLVLEAESADGTLTDVAWAVRTGGDTASCTGGSTDVQLDGNGSDLTETDGTWTKTLSTSGWDPGVYCFVFNTRTGPNNTDDGVDYRAVVEFNVGIPESKDACKNGGWETNFPEDTYRNQGQCVSEFARK